MSDTNTPGSKRFKLNKADGLEILKLIGYSLIASLLTILSDVSHLIDFGQYQGLAAVLLLPGLATIKKVFTDYAKLDE